MIIDLLNNSKLSNLSRP